MNKLEKIIIKPIDELNPFSYYDCNRESQRAKDNYKIAQKSAEITTDIAIKFARFCDDTDLSDNLMTWEDWFQEFINNHYETNNKSM
jgi:hypothetical protein